MHRYYFTLVCMVSTAIIATFLNNNGDFLVNAFEGDAFHLAAGVFRLLDGEVQHLDFHTPLGVLAFLPARILMSAGLGFGMAAAYSNLLVALAFMPVLIWVGETRFSGALRYGFAFVILLLFLALVRGGPDTREVGIALYYNRWCWAVSGLAIALVLLDGPDRPKAHLLDGVFLGVCFGFLALTKATFFIFLAPAVVIGLVARRRLETLSAAVATGGVILVTFLGLTGGTEVAQAYIGDLQAVVTGNLRTVPSQGIPGVVMSPEKLASSIAVLVAAVGLRRAGYRAEGLFLFFLFPGLALVTVQNWGNFGQWSFYLGLILWARIAQGDRRKPAHLVRMCGLAITVTALPQIMGMSDSLVTHKLLQQRSFVSVFDDPRLADFKFSRSRLASSQMRSSVLYGYEEQYIGDLDPPDYGSFQGQELVNCALKQGIGSYVKAIADDLAARDDVRGKQVLHASASTFFWLFGGTERLTNGQLWYYGGDTGFAEAEYFVLPFCVLGTSGLVARRVMVEELESNDEHNFSEVDRNELFVLYRRD